MNAEYALASLEFTPNKAAKIISKVLVSALANGGLEPSTAIVKSCRIDRGPVLKRFRPRARGSASKIRKPMAHVFVEVEIDKNTNSTKTISKKIEAKTTNKKTIKKVVKAKQENITKGDK
jgi:large subunit ribosomal protein L22